MSIRARSLSHYQVEITAGRHSFISDEPLGTGEDAGAEPFDLLLAGLASCVVITLHMYANRKHWNLEKVEAELSIHAALARDCPDCSSPPDATVYLIDKKLSFQGDLSPEQINRLTEIADRCPVQRALQSEIKIHTSSQQQL